MTIDPERHSSILAAMREEKLDALICSSPTEVLLLTGYWPVMGASIAVFTAEGEVHLMVPEDEQEIASKSSSAALIGFPSGKLDTLTTPRAAIQQPLVSLCTRLSLTGARIGLELEPGMQPSSYAASITYRSGLVDVLRDAFPQIGTVAADAMMARLKAQKTQVELAKIRTAALIASAGFRPIQDTIRPGLREAEIAALLQMNFESASSADKVQRSYGYFFCMSGPNSATAAAAYARTRQRNVQAGDLVMIHANTCGDGYWTDITRTETAGDLTERQMHMRAAIDEARQAALSVIRPGVGAQQVDQAARSVLERHGFGRQFKHGLGHGVGFAAANANAQPRIHPASPDILEAGMTFNVEPAIYFDDYGGMRHCDVVAVTASGVEVLTDF